MPVVSLNREDLEEMVGTDVHTIVELLPRLGADVGCVNDEIEVEFFPNRPDLFSVEGAARALRGMLGIETGLPNYTARPSGIEIEVDPSVNLVRPYIVCAVVRGVTNDERTIKVTDRFTGGLALGCRARSAKGSDWHSRSFAR